MGLRQPTILLATCAFVVGCGARSSDPPSSSEPVFSEAQTVLTGYRLFNWEYGHTLYALGLDGPICLQATDTELAEPEDDARFTELRGYLSARGTYREMAQCAYLFDISEIVEDRELTQHDRAVLGDLLKVIAEPVPGEIPGARFEQMRGS